MKKVKEEILWHGNYASALRLKFERQGDFCEVFIEPNNDQKGQFKHYPWMSRTTWYEETEEAEKPKKK